MFPRIGLIDQEKKESGWEEGQDIHPLIPLRIALCFLLRRFLRGRDSFSHPKPQENVSVT